MRALGVELAAICTCMALVSPAQAVGRLLVPGGSPARLSRVRVALTNTPERTTLWVSAALGGEAARAAWIVPVPPGTVADRASSRWLAALDDATAPRIFPPTSADPGCADPVRWQSTVEPPAAVELALIAADTLASLPDLEAYADSKDLAFGSDDRQLLGAHAGESRFLGLFFSGGRPGLWTEPVRITYPTRRASLALGLLRASSPSLTLFVLAEQGSSAAGLLEVPAPRLPITWSFRDGLSDYPSVRAELLGLYHGGAVVREYSASAALFASAALPEGAGFVSPAPVTYLERESSTVDTSTCSARLRDFVEQTARASLPCPAGVLARVPLGNGSEPICADAGGLPAFDVGGFACGGADELAPALGGLTPNAVVTRLELVVADDTPSELELRSETAAEQGSALRASSSMGSACGMSPAAGGAAGDGAPAGQQGPTAAAATVGQDAVPPTRIVMEVGCSADPGPAAEGAAEDTSGGEGEDCSSDHEYSGETCGSGTDDGYNGETCDSNSDDGYSGDTCSGGGGDCSLGRTRRHRTHLSAWVLGSALLAWPLRRRGRSERGNRTRCLQRPAPFDRNRQGVAHDARRICWLSCNFPVLRCCLHHDRGPPHRHGRDRAERWRLERRGRSGRRNLDGRVDHRRQ